MTPQSLPYSTPPDLERETAAPVTPNEDASKELSDLKFLLSRAQRIAHMGFWIMDLETERLDWSEETCLLFEMEPAEFGNRFDLFLEKVLPEDRSKITAAIERAENGDGRLEATYRIRLKDGSIRWLFEQGDIERDAGGRPLRRVGVVMDVTPQKQTEQRLALNENLNRMAATLSQVGGWAFDLESQALYWSDTVKEIHGVEPGYVPSVEEALEFYTPEHQRQVQQAFKACLAQGIPYDLELTIVRASGQQLWVRTIGQPVCDEHGRVIRLEGAFQDISAQKEVELELARQAQLLDQASDAILVRDLKNQVIYLNQKAEQLYECSSEEALGQSVADLIYNDPLPLENATRAVLDQGQWTGELQHRTKSGREVTIFGRWTLMHDGDGVPKAILAINTDITESRKLEQQFVQNQRLESVGRLASGIAHDLNNVLAPILISLELLREQVVHEDAVKLVETLESSAHRGANLVRQILSLVQGFEGNPTPIDPKEVIAESAQIVQETFPKNIDLVVKLPEKAWILEVDPTHLHQVLMNLLVNARDAMPAGGQLTLELQNQQVDEVFAGLKPGLSPGPHLLFQVRDTGSGIPADLVQKVFEPFFTTKERGQGTGLGLSTCFSIVQGYGGFLELESQQGSGTVFRFYLPASEVQTSPEQYTAEASLPRGQGELILLVDDEDNILSVARQALERYGYQVVTAGNGAEGVSQFLQHRDLVRCVLTDMSMPVMDGPAFIAALRSIDPLIPVIGSSGLTSPEKMGKAVQAGVQKFVPKPYTSIKLLSALQQVLRPNTAALTSRQEKPSISSEKPNFSSAQSDSGPEPAREASSLPLVILVVEDELLLQRLACRVLSSQGHTIHTADEGQQALDTLKKLDGKVDLVITDLNMPNMGGEELYRQAHQLYPDLRFVFTSGDSHIPSTLSDALQDRLVALLKPYSIQDLKQVVSKARNP